MVIADLNVTCVAINEPKADPPLVVYRYRVLPFSVALERMKPVARRRLQIVQPHGQVQVLELSGRPFSDIWRKPFGLAISEELLSSAIRERFDHGTEGNASRDSRQAGSRVPHNDIKLSGERSESAAARC
jgi:hypothetical protein